jgi:hypothetical protein
MLANAGLGLRFNEHLDEEDGPLVFEHACRLGLVAGKKLRIRS